MRRVVVGAALALALAGCASPQADLQDQVADVTSAANAGSVEGLLAEAQALEALVDRLEDGGDLTAGQATRLRNAAVALQQRAGQLRPSPSPVPEPEPTQAPPPPPPSPEPEPTEEEPSPSPSPSPEPEPEEPVETEEPDDGGLLPLPTQDEPEPQETQSAVTATPATATRAAAPRTASPATTTAAVRGRRTPSPSASPTLQPA